MYRKIINSFFPPTTNWVHYSSELSALLAINTLETWSNLQKIACYRSIFELQFGIVWAVVKWFNMQTTPSFGCLKLIWHNILITIIEKHCKIERMAIITRQFQWFSLHNTVVAIVRRWNEKWSVIQTTLWAVFFFSLFSLLILVRFFCAPHSCAND